jgi:hypothetical protein
VASLAPAGRLSVSRQGADVVATVRMAVHPLASWLPAVTVSERAVAAIEPRAGAS